MPSQMQQKLKNQQGSGYPLWEGTVIVSVRSWLVPFIQVLIQGVDTGVLHL